MRPPLRYMIPVVAVMLHASISSASVATVPDDFPTVQLAIDSGADSVMIREGTYPERIRVGKTRLILGLAGATGRPRMQGLVVKPTGIQAPIDIVSCAFDGAAELQAGQEFATVTFDACTLDSGVVEPGVGETFDYEFVSVYRSRIRGNMIIFGNAHCEADTFVTGRVVLDGDVSHTVVGCRFEGASSAAISFGSYGDHQIDIRDNDIVGAYEVGIALWQILQGNVTSNRISGCTRLGIDSYAEYYQLIGNVVTNCPTGIRFTGSGVEALGNIVRDCGTGMSGYFDSGILRDNVVLGSSGHGIDLALGDYSYVDYNVVGRSGGDGMRLDWPRTSKVLHLGSNTSYRNGGAGFRLMAPPLSYGLDFYNSIAFENAGFGVDADTGSVTLHCNDLYGNQAGATRGVEDLATNREVDPLFCDVDHDSVGLTPESPVLNPPECGLIGARGVGCVETAVLLSLFTAERRGPDVVLRWRLESAGVFSEVWIERASAPSGPWSVVPIERSREGDMTVAFDRSVATGVGYWYRLAARRAGQTVVLGEALAVAPELAARFELQRVTPNPAMGPVRFEIMLARDARVEIDVYDVLGRRVASVLNATLPAGFHSVPWLRAARYSPGLYLARYGYPEGQQVRRFIVAR